MIYKKIISILLVITIPILIFVSINNTNSLMDIGPTSNYFSPLPNSKKIDNYEEAYIANTIGETYTIDDYDKPPSVQVIQRDIDNRSDKSINKTIVSEDNEYDDDISNSEIKNDRVARRKTIEYEFFTQDIDPVWREMMEKRLYSNFSEELIKASSIYSLECRSSICRIIINHDSQKSQREWSLALHKANPVYSNIETFSETQNGLPMTIAFSYRVKGIEDI